MMELLLVFILGACIGSYVNVLRIRGFVKSCINRSYCPNCKTQLKWYHLIPILSFVFLNGKCSYCNSKIEIKYILFELIFGIIFLLLYYIYTI